MPSVVRGTHAFRPSQQTYGAIANAASSSGPSNNAPGGASMPPPQSVPRDDPETSDEDAIPPPTTPLRPSSVVSSSTSASKRKHSTLDESTSTSFRASSTSSYSKRQRNSTPNGAAALHGIGDALHDFHGTMRDGPMTQPRRHRRSSAERRIEATALLQNTETLTAEEAIAFADLFEQNTARADTYMALVRADVRKLWVQKQLQQMGFPGEGSGETEN